MEKYQDTLLTKFNYDEYGNPISVLQKETQVITKKSAAQLMQFPDEFHRVLVRDMEGNYLTESHQAGQLREREYFVNYTNGVVYFHSSQVAQSLTFEYYGRGVEMISTSRLFHKYDVDGREFTDCLTDIVDELIDAATEIVVEEQKRQENEQNRIERFDQQMILIQQEILDKDSAFQSQLQNQQTTFEGLVEEAEDKILGSDNLFNQQMDKLDQQFNDKVVDWQAHVDGLTEQIDNGTLEIASLKARLDVDFKQTPIYHRTLRGVRTSVMQQFAKFRDGTFLFSQSGASSVSPLGESFTLTHLSADLNILSKMELIGGGHGWFQAREVDGEIELHFTNAKSELVKMNYQPDATIDFGKSTDYEVLPNYESVPQLLAIDYENDILMLMPKNKAYGVVNFFKYSDYVAGTQTTPHLTLNNTVASDETLQGFGVRGTQGFIYTGALGAVCAMRVYDLTTGTYKQYSYPRLGYSQDLDMTTTVEGEGLFIDNDVLYVGVAIGKSGSARVNNIHVFAPVEKQGALVGESLARGQNFPLTAGNGVVKPINHHLPMLSHLVEPGEYYFSSSEFNFADVPEEYRGKGYFLNVSARAQNGTVFQTLTRITSSTNIYRLGRQVSIDGVPGAWKPLMPEKKSLYYGDSRNSVSITLSDSISNYDFVLVRVWSAGGQWQSFMFDSAIVMTTRALAIQSTNLPDSSSSSNIYFQELICSIDEAGLTITQDRKSQIQINQAGTLTRSEDSSVGICEIIGIRGFNTL